MAAEVAHLASARGVSIGVAESLTGGMVSASLAAAEGASEWYRGAVVSYSSAVKHDLLEVPAGPVVSEQAALAMVRRVRSLLGADVAAAVTGAGGPDPQDGCAPGTIYLGVADATGERVVRRELHGEPEQVCVRAAEEVLEAIVAWLRSLPATGD
ncbi:CinA family protein [Pseudonocardia sp. KRD-291]|nr:CinA family protein [Pseudonocardia sp. KRD291]